MLSRKDSRSVVLRLAKLVTNTTIATVSTSPRLRIVKAKMIGEIRTSRIDLRGANPSSFGPSDSVKKTKIDRNPSMTESIKGKYPGPISDAVPTTMFFQACTPVAMLTNKKNAANSPVRQLKLPPFPYGILIDP